LAWARDLQLAALPCLKSSGKSQRFDDLKGSEKIFEIVVVTYKTINNATSSFDNMAWNPEKCIKETFEFHAKNLITEYFVRSEASPPFRAGLPGKEDRHFCIAPLDPALPGGACGEHAGQQPVRGCQKIN